MGAIREYVFEVRYSIEHDIILNEELKYKNELLIKTLAAKAFFKAGDYTKAAQISCSLNQQRPTVDTLLLEAKTSRLKKNFNSAIELLERAERTLEGKDELWT